MKKSNLKSQVNLLNPELDEIKSSQLLELNQQNQQNQQNKQNGSRQNKLNVQSNHETSSLHNSQASQNSQNDLFSMGQNSQNSNQNVQKQGNSNSGGNHSSLLTSTFDSTDKLSLAMLQAENELQALHRTYQQGPSLHNLNETLILNKIDQISQIQVRAFMNAIDIERKWPNVVMEKGDREGVKKAFHEKEKAVSSLVRRLQGISQHIDQINSQLSE